MVLGIDAVLAGLKARYLLETMADSNKTEED